MKLEASKTAEIDSRAIERATCSGQAWVDLFCCFFIELFRLKQFSCRFLLSPSFSTICRSGLRKSPEIGKDLDSRVGTRTVPTASKSSDKAKRDLFITGSNLLNFFSEIWPPKLSKLSRQYARIGGSGGTRQVAVYRARFLIFSTESP
jgi:hypothetical protein